MVEDCFYACLREASLEQYYHNFVKHGITCSSSLTEVHSKDYTSFGVKANQDQKRLYQLIDIIRKLDTSGVMSTSISGSRSSVQSPAVTPQALYGAVTGKQAIYTKTTLSRQRSSHSESDGDTLREEEASEYFSNNNIMRNSFHHADQNKAFPPTSSYFSSRYSNNQPGQRSAAAASVSRISDSDDDEDVTVAPSSPNTSVRAPRNKSPTVQQSPGYNYGLPNTSPSPTRKVARVIGKNSDKIRVCVRKRPLLRKERSEDYDIVRVTETTIVSVFEEKSAVDLKKYTQQHEFLFDESFDETDNNASVFKRTAKPLISHVLDGGKSTCFAYGQTGSGKSFTIMGSTSNPGLYALAGEQIFAGLKNGQTVYVAFFEIYCGHLYDLLNGRSRLHAREDGKQRVQISNLREVKVLNNRHLMQVVEVGSKSRSVGASGVNPDSSRSHAVLQIQIKTTSSKGDSSKGRISFIDLAGSERAAEAGDQNKITRQEGAEINTSLLALKECIRALDQDSKHTPFRQSKLTQVLKESFIGNSKTCMIANISPTNAACDNTLNTLRYADRVKELRKQGLLGGHQSSSANSSPTKVSSPKFARKSAKSSSITAATSSSRAVPSQSQNEPNRTTSRKTRQVPSVKRSSSDVTMNTNRNSSMTAFDPLENELYRSISLEGNDAFEELDLPLPRNLPPEPQQATWAIDSPSSPSSGSNSPVSPAHTSDRMPTYGQAENERFAANYIKNYAPASRESINIARKSVSSPDLRRDAEGQLNPSPTQGADARGGDSGITGFIGYELSKLNANTDMFLKKLKSSRKSGAPTGSQKVQAVRTNVDAHTSPRTHRKMVKFLGIESGTYSDFDYNVPEIESAPVASKMDAVLHELSSAKSAAVSPRRYYNSADDIHQDLSERSPDRVPTPNNAGSSKSTGKILLVENRHRRSPSVSEDEAFAAVPNAQAVTDSQQPVPPHTPRPPRTSREKTSSSPTPVAPISKKMTLAEFAKSPPPKKGRPQSAGSSENLTQQTQLSAAVSDTLVNPESPVAESHRKGSRNSSGDDATSSESPRQQCSSSTEPSASVSSFNRSQSLRSVRSKAAAASEVAAVTKRARSQSPTQTKETASNTTVALSTAVSAAQSGGTPSNIIHKAQSQLVTAHKDHLAVVSKLCTKELGFLQDMEVGNKAFRDYAKQLDSTLTRKLKAITQMKAHIAEYNKLCEGK